MRAPVERDREAASLGSTIEPFGSRLLGPLGQHADALRVRLQIVVTVAIVVANLVGVGVVTMLGGWVVPRPEPLGGSMFVANAIAIPIYVAGAVAVGVVWGTRSALAKVAWAVEGAPPLPGEQRAALRAPLGLARVQLVLWGGAVPVFGAIAWAAQPAMAVGVVVTVALGGVVTCSVSYLLSEFLFRPVAARALAVDPPQEPLVPGVKARALLAWTLGSGVPTVGLVAVAVLSLVRDDVSATQLAVTIVALGAVTLSVGSLLAWLAVRATVDPLRALRIAARRVEGGDLRTEVVVYDGSEIGLLQAAFNRMVGGLRERERIRDLFGRHVGEDVARKALVEGVELGGEVRDVAVLFVDIVGSTEMAAARPPTEVVALLNRFFGVVIAAVADCGGSINKFEGDAALAVFGAPVAMADHAGAALRTARTLNERLVEVVPECPAGIGIAVGRAVAGNVGGERRYEYTVIGDPVNEAARLCELAKSKTPRVVASTACVEQAAGAEPRAWRADGETTLRGRPEPTGLAVPTG